VSTVWLRLKAPFAAYRYFQAGVYRATAPIIPHSAAWGLALNLAGVEVRKNLQSPVTEISSDAPKLQIAVGALDKEPPERCSLYQQLHTYPVGKSGKEFAERAKGAKYWIAPVRRELLIGLNALIGIRSSDETVLHRIIKGVHGELAEPRYGLPFAGDNNLLFDQIDVLSEPEPTYWYSPLESGDVPRKGSCRLSVQINRTDSSKTSNLLFAPEELQLTMPPDSAWVWTPSAP
jgi:CRISPR-associated protein Cas5t